MADFGKLKFQILWYTDEHRFHGLKNPCSSVKSVYRKFKVFTANGQTRQGWMAGGRHVHQGES